MRRSRVIWQHATTGDWTEIYRTSDAMPFVAVLATGDGRTFATSDAGTVRGDGTTWIVDETLQREIALRRHGRRLARGLFHERPVIRRDYVVSGHDAGDHDDARLRR